MKLTIFRIWDFFFQSAARSNIFLLPVGIDMLILFRQLFRPLSLWSSGFDNGYQRNTLNIHPVYIFQREKENLKTIFFRYPYFKIVEKYLVETYIKQTDFLVFRARWTTGPNSILQRQVEQAPKLQSDIYKIQSQVGLQVQTTVRPLQLQSQIRVAVFFSVYHI